MNNILRYLNYFRFVLQITRIIFFQIHITNPTQKVRTTLCLGHGLFPKIIFYIWGYFISAPFNLTTSLTSFVSFLPTMPKEYIPFLGPFHGKY